VLALLLGLQVAGLLRHLGDNSLGLGEALLRARLQLTARWAAKLFGDLFTLSLRRILLDVLLLGLTDLLGPLGTLLLSGVTLSDILALLLLDCLALHDIIFDVMLVVPGLALGLVDSPALDWALSVTDQRSVAELNLLLGGDLSVVDEAVLDEVLLAFLLLLGLEVSGVSGVALLGVAMLALDDVIILSLLNHHNLVDTPLTGSSNGSNVKSNVITTTALTGVTSRGSLSSMGMSMIMGMIMGMVTMGMGSLTIALVEREGSPKVLALPVRASSSGTGSKEAEKGQTLKAIHD